MFNHFNKFDSFNHFSIKLNKEAVYNPYINYTWEMLPNAKVKNSGTSGVDLQLYSGNPLDFQATQGIQVNKSFTLSGNAISLYLGFDTDSIAITHTLAEFDNLKVSIVNATLKVTINAVNHDVATLSINTYYQTEIVINSNNLTVKLNGTQTYSASCTALNTTILKSIGANDGLSSGRFDGQFDYFIAYNGLTTFSLPNQFFKDMSTNSNTLFATDFRGNVGYIADSKNYSVGSELVTNGTFDTWTNDNPNDFSVLNENATNYVTESNGKLRMISDNTTTLAIRPNPQTMISQGIVYILSFDLVVFNGAITTNYSSGSAYSTSGQIKLLFTGALISYLQIYNSGVCDCEIDNVSIKPIQNIYPVTNYSPTMRTNFQTETTGMQELMIERDSLGFFLGLREFPKGNGVGYGNTEWIPSADEDWTIEITQKYESSGLYQRNGVRYGAEYNSTVMIGFSSSAKATFGITNLSSFGNITYLNGDIAKLILRYNSSSKTYTSFENGNFIQNVTRGAFITGTSSFKLCKYDSLNETTGEIPKFKVHKKLLTDEEIQAL